MTTPKKPTKPAKKTNPARAASPKATPKKGAGTPKVKTAGKPMARSSKGPLQRPAVDPLAPTAAALATAERGRESIELNGLTESVLKAYGSITAREQAFIENYVTLRSAEPSAVAAGYSKAYARSHAGKLLNKPAIRAVITELDRLNLDALLITDGAIIEKLWQEANFAFESSSRVKALLGLAELRDMFPAKKVKHGLLNPGEEALFKALEEIDGAGTGLPKPEPADDGRRAH